MQNSKIFKTDEHAFVGSWLSLSLVQLPVNLGLGGEGEEGFALGNSVNQVLLEVGGCYDLRLSFKPFQSLAISKGSHVAVVAVGISSKATDMLNVNAFSHPRNILFSNNYQPNLNFFFFAYRNIVFPSIG